jgi:hypothetical protein
MLEEAPRGRTLGGIFQASSVIMKVEGKVRVMVRLHPASMLHEMSIALSGEVDPVLRRIIITVAISYRF